LLSVTFQLRVVYNSEGAKISLFLVGYNSFISLYIHSVRTLMIRKVVINNKYLFSLQKYK